MTKREAVARELYRVSQNAKNKALHTTLGEDEFVRITLEGAGCLRPATIKEMKNEIKLITTM